MFWTALSYILQLRVQQLQTLSFMFRTSVSSRSPIDVLCLVCLSCHALNGAGDALHGHACRGSPCDQRLCGPCCWKFIHIPV